MTIGINPSHYALMLGYEVEMGIVEKPSFEMRERNAWGEREYAHYNEGIRLAKIEKGN